MTKKQRNKKYEGQKEMNKSHGGNDASSCRFSLFFNSSLVICDFRKTTTTTTKTRAAPSTRVVATTKTTTTGTATTKSQQKQQPNKNSCVYFPLYLIGAMVSSAFSPTWLALGGIIAGVISTVFIFGKK